MVKRRFGIVNNGFAETIFDVDNGKVVCQVLLEEKEGALSVVSKMAVDNDIEVVSYSLY